MISLEYNNLDKLNLFIESELDNPRFSIDFLCKNLGMSRTQLYRIIKEQTKLSVSLYIRKVRIEKAKHLLLTSNQRISEIADNVGISSPQNFSKYFTDEFGISPTEFRKHQLIVQKQLETKTLDNEAPIGTIAVLQPKKKQAYLWASLGILIATIIGLILWQNTANSLPNKKSNFGLVNEISENSIAILPFKNLGESQNSFFCTGVMEQIHSSLASINELKIISTTSSNQYLNTKKSITQIANELNVKYILEGSVLQFQKKVKISVELINAKDDRVIWTKNQEGKIDDIFLLINSVAKEVVGELNQKLSTDFNKKTDKIPTKSIAAYNEYLQGKQLLQTREKEKLEASVIKFNNAIEFDPKFADAYASKATVYYLLGDDQLMDVQLGYKMAERNALTSIRLDAENGTAYAVLGNVYKAQNKWEQAITTFQIALKYSPNNAQINYWYSLTIRSLGNTKEAVDYSTKAVTLDPLSHNIYGGHIINCTYAQKFDLALKAINEGALFFNDAYLFHNAKGFYYIVRENYNEALKSFSRTNQLQPNLRAILTMINYSRAKLGETKVVNEYLFNLPKTPDNYKYFAIVYAGLGNKELCLNYLEMAAENSDSPNYLKVSPLFNFIHGEARFTAILKKLGLLETFTNIQ